MKLLTFLLLVCSVAFGADVSPEDLVACRSHRHDTSKLAKIKRVSFDASEKSITIVWKSGARALYEVIKKRPVYFSDSSMSYFAQYIAGKVPVVDPWQVPFITFIHPNYEKFGARYDYESWAGSLSFMTDQFEEAKRSYESLVCGPWMDDLNM